MAARRSASLKPVQAAASARPCSNATQGGFRKSGIVMATMANAVRDADEEIGRAAGEVLHGCILAARGRDPGEARPYSSSSVFAWSHQPSIVRSVGGSTSSSARPAGCAR